MFNLKDEDYREIDKFFGVFFMTIIAIASVATTVKYVRWLFQ